MIYCILKASDNNLRSVIAIRENQTTSEFHWKSTNRGKPENVAICEYDQFMDNDNDIVHICNRHAQ